MIGSTANIVALGMLEKRYGTGIHFFQWFKTGVVVGLVTCLISWAGISLLSSRMPTHAERVEAAAQRMNQTLHGEANSATPTVEEVDVAH